MNEIAIIKDLVAKLLLAAFLGGIIGLEREIHDKPAGVRTQALICLGSALFMIISIHVAQSFGDKPADPGRIAAQVITGIGFIGAGVIFQARGSVHGLTTAATIWSVTAVGLAIGCGYYIAALTAAAIILIILLVIGRIERYLVRREQ